MDGITKRRSVAYIDCAAKTASVTGQAHATVCSARPLSDDPLAPAMKRAGATSRPASAVNATKTRGARRNCAI